ncbi:MAG: MFS transporter [Clostridiales bacterium]|nr:MFS transporter [Clostridiales bacterium]
MENQNKKLPFGRMLAFAIGDFFGGGAFNIINFLYPGFLALVIGLPAELAGLLMMIARIFDAVIDPFIGFYSDKLRARFGTRRGSIIAAAPLVVLSLFLMFFPFQYPGLYARFFAVLFSYIFFCAVQSVIMIPYYSLTGELTWDYTDRARITSLRLGFSIFASIVCVAVPGMIIDAFDGNTGYIVMSLSFGVLFMLCVGATGLFAKEGIPAEKEVPRLSLREFIRPLRVKVFRQYLYIFLCCQMTMAIMSALFFFYVDFFFCAEATAAGQSNMVGMIGAALMFGMQIVALPVYLAMIKKTSKTAVYIFGSAIWIVGALALFFMPAGANPLYLYLLAAILGFGISGPGLIPHAIFADVVDVGTLQFGTAAPGAFSGIANFINSIAQAIGLAIVMAGLGLAGFVEKDILSGVEVLSQPLSAQNAIIAIMALAPLLFMSIGIFFCTRYKLNKERHAAVVAALEGSEEERLAVLRTL